MKKQPRFCEVGHLPPYRDTATIDELNVIDDSAMDAVNELYDLRDDLDETRARHAEVVSRTEGDVDAITAEATELHTRIQVLETMEEAKRLQVIQELKRCALKLSDKVAIQRQDHIALRTEARASVKEWAAEKFEKRAAGMIEMMHSKDTLKEKNSRIILDTLANRLDEIRQRLAEFQTPDEARSPAANAFYGSSASTTAEEGSLEGVG